MGQCQELYLYLLENNSMEVSWTIIGVIGVAVVILIGYLIRQNQKDEHKLEQFLNNDYKKEEEEEEELDTDNDQEN